MFLLPTSVYRSFQPIAESSIVRSSSPFCDIFQTAAVCIIEIVSFFFHICKIFIISPKGSKSQQNLKRQTSQHLHLILFIFIF